MAEDSADALAGDHRVGSLEAAQIKALVGRGEYDKVVQITLGQLQGRDERAGHDVLAVNLIDHQ